MAGYPAAPTTAALTGGRADRELAREAGCEAVTLAKLLADARRGVTPGYETTIIVDEAGMAATDQIAQLVSVAMT